MTERWAAEFRDIPETLAERPDLRAAMRALCAAHEIPVKVTEGGDRRARRKLILDALFAGTIDLAAAEAATETALARTDSPHAASNLVFAKGWAHRLVATHYSVFYSWAVLDELIARGERAWVARATTESPTSRCSRLLAERAHDPAVLRGRLIRCYVEKQPAREPLVPDHPHCTHVASRVPE